ncbi:MAG: hypothetical protein MUO51_07485 [Woeseiaceae bacterium]|nr:hypothetical protein [Woeseiaceae bacterium]
MHLLPIAALTKVRQHILCTPCLSIRYSEMFGLTHFWATGKNGDVVAARESVQYHSAPIALPSDDAEILGDQTCRR